MRPIIQDKLILLPARFSGAWTARPSKSQLHRLMLLAACAGGESSIHIGARPLNRDNQLLLSALGEMGLCAYAIRGEQLHIDGRHKRPAWRPRLDCGQGAAVLRLLLPLVLHFCGGAEFVCAPELLRRPHLELLEALRGGGAEYKTGERSLSVSGELSGGCYRLSGSGSSQFASALLLALPFVEQPSRIEFAAPPQSRPYIEMTIAALRLAGITDVSFDERSIAMAGGAQAHGFAARAEGDHSHAANFIVAAALGGDISIAGLDERSLQGDRVITLLLREMGADCAYRDGLLRVRGGRELRGIDVDMRHTPDLLPPLAIAAAAAQGPSRFHQAGRLRDKESDRLSATAAAINALGGRAAVEGDSLLIAGGGLSGGSVDGCGDHRVVMAAAIAAAACMRALTLSDAAAVHKSAPEFWQDYQQLGGRIVYGQSMGK
ncbi:MAG: 3-phosphoshikimate 1-carboxyvinyltransferase [Bacillota bacterium]|nr:3-phosphoshikimate 1-carboxyvinyltransferase [Bacillota bacterium]